MFFWLCIDLFDTNNNTVQQVIQICTHATVPLRMLQPQPLCDLLFHKPSRPRKYTLPFIRHPFDSISHSGSLFLRRPSLRQIRLNAPHLHPMFLRGKTKPMVSRQGTRRHIRPTTRSHVEGWPTGELSSVRLDAAWPRFVSGWETMFRSLSGKSG